MTAQSSDAGSDPQGRRQLSLSERDSTPFGAFLRTRPDDWGGPVTLADHAPDDGFAALRFDATPGSVTRTRRFLRSTLTDWQLPELVDDATTITAELVANAVTHALCPAEAPRLADATAAWLALVREDHAVVCAVADPSPALPTLHEAELFAESGRGLHIVAELSETWGHARAEGPWPTGKTVWARLASGR
jgi:anti-sigma regulatory factor (Ser/Thr protein kinase)